MAEDISAARIDHGRMKDITMLSRLASAIDTGEATVSAAQYRYLAAHYQDLLDKLAVVPALKAQAVALFRDVANLPVEPGKTNAIRQLNELVTSIGQLEVA